ncbi:hypothetical protein HA402_014626 [Bradysia odoriphaga]|nr:hypothetical protein HA402_014626 [Bradysia odoriphaga]
MCKRAQIIINCVGPYSLYREVVVENCILAKSHHVDLAGDPFFLEGMQLKYHDKAVEAGVFIVGSCGFDSIPANLGIIELQKNCSGEIAWIVTFAKVTAGESGSVINHGTWDSAIQFIANLRDLKRVRRELYESFFKVSFPTFTHKCKQKYLPNTLPEIGEVTVPYWEMDKFVVKRTQFYSTQGSTNSNVGLFGGWLLALSIWNKHICHTIWNICFLCMRSKIAKQISIVL